MTQDAAAVSSAARTTPSPIRVAIIDDDEATREGLRELVADEDGFECRLTFGSVEEALAARRIDADVILVDIQLPGVSGVEGVPFLRERHPAAHLIMHTVFDDDQRVFQALCHGACGYVLKRMPPRRLLDAIADACAGGSPISPEIARKVVGALRTSAAPPVDVALTPQERRLLALLGEGCTYRAAGAELGITANTVRNYIRSIYEKLQVHTKAQAVSKALRGRLLK